MQATMPMTQAKIGAVPRSDREEDRPEFDQMFMDNKDLVFRAAYRITGNASDAEDVLQTVFLRLLRQDQPPEIRHLRAYLHRAAVNAALDTLRMKKDAQNVPLEDSPALPEVATLSGRVPGELQDWLRQALAKLNPRWAEMFVLRFIEDYSNGEIARLMKTSAAVVAVVLHRTRAQLKKDFMASTGGGR
ncbi:MAG TPA: sigma-70 family RNA polymerase sigma factor [Candidatus Angelobacter sp.]|nr:sigma-70 family RNA polymerase sigma factor [Candidatus Angelobacter sp.]